MKRLNEYATYLPPALYERMPKAVAAALAVSYALRFATGDPEDAGRVLLKEWGILYDNGIVPQQPPAAWVLEADPANWSAPVRRRASETPEES